jgi:hypothetical protein
MDCALVREYDRPVVCVEGLEASFTAVCEMG